MKKITVIIALSFLLLPGLISCNSHNRTHDENEELNSVQLSDAGRQSSCVFLNTDNEGKPIISWVEIDTASGEKYFYYARFKTKAGKFSKPISIPIEQNASIHEEGMPKIAVKGDGSLFAMYEVSIPKKGMKWGLGDIRYEQSFDGGQTWTTPKSVDAKAFKNNLSGNFTNLTRLADGKIGITWLGTNPESEGMSGMKMHEGMKMVNHETGKMHTMKGRPLLFAKTTNDSAITDPVIVAHQACQCCRTALSSDKDGRIRVAFRDLLPGDIRDISLSTSNNAGQSFTQPHSFSGDHWQIEGCPHDGPAVVARGDKTYVTWFTGSDKNTGVNYAVLGQNNKVLYQNNLSPKGKYIQLCLLPNGTPVMVYNKYYNQDGKSYSKIILNKVKDRVFFHKDLTLPDIHATYPVISPVDNHHVVVAWRNEGEIFYQYRNLKGMKKSKTSQMANTISESSVSTLFN